MRQGKRVCIACTLGQNKRYVVANPERAKAVSRGAQAKFRQTNPESVKAISKRFYEAHRPEILEREQRKRSTPEFKTAQTEYNVRLKIQTFLAYSENGQICCLACGFPDIRALSIDHIDGGGNLHRSEIGGGGLNTYRWLKKNNFPPGFQVLCMNCQFIKKFENRDFTSLSERTQNA